MEHSKKVEGKWEENAGRKLPVPRDVWNKALGGGGEMGGKPEKPSKPHWEGQCPNAGTLNFVLGTTEK